MAEITREDVEDFVENIRKWVKNKREDIPTFTDEQLDWLKEDLEEFFLP